MPSQRLTEHGFRSQFRVPGQQVTVLEVALELRNSEEGLGEDGRRVKVTNIGQARGIKNEIVSATVSEIGLETIIEEVGEIIFKTEKEGVTSFISEIPMPNNYQLRHITLKHKTDT